jgi:hypothetical protein
MFYSLHSLFIIQFKNEVTSFFISQCVYTRVVCTTFTALKEEWQDGNAVNRKLRGVWS